jgi:hypothetical protein
MGIQGESLAQIWHKGTGQSPVVAQGESSQRPL